MTKQESHPAKFTLRAQEVEAIQWTPYLFTGDDVVAARERISAFLGQIILRQVEARRHFVPGDGPDSFEWNFTSDDGIMIVQTKPGESTATVVRPGMWISYCRETDEVDVDTDEDFHVMFRPVKPGFTTTVGEFASIPHIVHAVQQKGEKTPDLIELLGESVLPEAFVPAGYWVVRYVEGKFLVLSDEEFRERYLPSGHRSNEHIELTLPMLAVAGGTHTDAKMSLYFKKPEGNTGATMLASIVAQLLPVQGMDPDDVAAVQRTLALLRR